MKKLISLVLVAVLLCSVVLPVAAEEFVPSISYKDSPEIVGKPEITDKDDKEVTGAQVVITPVSDALETPEQERSDEEALLVEVFDKLNNGDMKLPVPDGDGGEEYYVVRDLFDIDIDYGTQEPTENVRIEVTFDLGVEAGAEVAVMFFDGTWVPMENIKNNGDGTVTVVFDKLGPVAFCVEDTAQSAPTSDELGQKLLPWTILMFLAAAAVVFMLISRRKVAA